jgi:NAD-dependent deacetylase
MPAIELAEQADYFLIIGTSLQVYPAASLYQYVSSACKVWAIDPHLTASQISGPVELIQKNATEAVPELVSYLLAGG